MNPLTGGPLTAPFLGVDSWRNRLAHRIANWVLNHIATSTYRDLIEALISVGINETYGRANRKAAGI